MLDAQLVHPRHIGLDGRPHDGKRTRCAKCEADREKLLAEERAQRHGTTCLCGDCVDKG